MNTKKEADLLAQIEPQPKKTDMSIASPEEAVNTLRALRLKKEIPAQAMVNVVRQHYPGYDKPLQSKAERSHIYGIRLCDKAMAALIEVFAPEDAPKPKAPENRINPCRLVCRVSVSDYNLLMDCMRAEGFSTTQDWLYSQIKSYLKSKGAYQ